MPAARRPMSARGLPPVWRAVKGSPAPFVRTLQEVVKHRSGRPTTRPAAAAAGGPSSATAEVVQTDPNGKDHVPVLRGSPGASQRPATGPA